jgi:predicted secreted hydrolase
MDKEISSQQLDAQKGWDWFSIQLQDGREVMLYLLRNQQNELDFGRGTVVPKDMQRPGAVRYLTPDDWTLTTGRTWTSPHSGARYPNGWALQIPSEDLDVVIEPTIADQENLGEGPGLPYWEGASIVKDRQGAEVGRAFVELTGWTD